MESIRPGFFGCGSHSRLELSEIFVQVSQGSRELRIHASARLFELDWMSWLSLPGRFCDCTRCPWCTTLQSLGNKKTLRWEQKTRDFAKNVMIFVVCNNGHVIVSRRTWHVCPFQERGSGGAAQYISIQCIHELLTVALEVHQATIFNKLVVPSFSFTMIFLP